MQSQWIAHVGALLFDPVHSNRHLTRNGLFTLGFRDIDTPVALAELRHALETREYDLCILDVTDQPGPICDLIQGVRHGTVGRNPFLVILATTWNQSRDLVRKVIDAGAEDLILRPLSIGTLKARILLQTEARKDFVVTSTYIGPDRRRDPARSAPAALIPAPNALKAKAQDGLLSGPSAAQIADARRQVERLRLQQNAMRIAIGARLIADHVCGGQPASVLDSELTQLTATAQDIKMRSADPSLAHLVSLCDGAVEAMGRLRSAIAGPNAVQTTRAPLELLEQLSYAVRRSLDPASDDAALHAEISRTVSRIKAHQADDATRSKVAGA